MDEDNKTTPILEPPQEVEETVDSVSNDIASLSRQIANLAKKIEIIQAHKQIDLRQIKQDYLALLQLQRAKTLRYTQLFSDNNGI